MIMCQVTLSEDVLLKEGKLHPWVRCMWRVALAVAVSTIIVKLT